MTALGAAALDNGTPALGAHPGTKPVLALAATYIWLIGAFHKKIQIRGVGERRQVMKHHKTLSKRSAPKRCQDQAIRHPRWLKREKFDLAAKERLAPFWWISPPFDPLRTMPVFLYSLVRQTFASGIRRSPSGV